MEDIDPRLFEKLPLDVVHQILINLPVKSLIRFRVVCKSWYRLFSDPAFHKEHYHRSQRRPLLFTARYEFDDPSMTKWMHFSTHNNEGAFINNFSRTGRICTYGYPIQSCLGLVCMASIYESNESNIVIVNPSTEEVLVLPLLHPPRIIQCIGFGHIASRDEFKVVSFFHYAERPQCEVLTLGDNMWRSAKSLPPFSFRYAYAPFVHGALHLLPLGISYFDHVQNIAAFDLESEEYRWIQLPKCYYMKGIDLIEVISVSLTELGGSLFLNFSDMQDKKELEMWFLKNYKTGEWVKAYIIDFSLEFKDVANTWPLAIMGDGTILVQVDAEGESKMMHYNPREKHFSPWINIKCCAATFYVESLVPLHRPSYQNSFFLDPIYDAPWSGAWQQNTFKDFWGKHTWLCPQSCSTSVTPAW